MSTISQFADKLSRILAFVAAVGVVAMMIHVCADVISRLLTGASLPATVEMVSYYYMVLVAFLPLAWVERRGGMISVELLDFMLSNRMRRLSDSVVGILALGIYTVMAYASWLTAVRNYNTGTFVVALQMKIITWPGYFLPPAGFALAALIVAVRLLQIATDQGVAAQEPDA